LANATAVLEGKDAFQVTVWRQRLIGRAWLRGRHGKSAVMPSQVSWQKLIAFDNRSHTCQFQLQDQAILECPKHPLDAALGLWCGGRYRSDAEILQQATKLCRIRLPGQLFFQCQGLLEIDLKNAVLIVIDLQRTSIGGDHLSHQQEIAVGIFLLAKNSPDHFSSRIIFGSEENGCGMLGPKPMMFTAIDLDQHAFLRP